MEFFHFKAKRIGIFLFFLAVFDLAVWWVVAVGEDREAAAIFFFDVGQGDASLIALPGGVEVLVDGGPPNGRVMSELAEALRPTDRYLDLVVMTHPELDHFGGLIEALDSYEVGAFIANGRAGKAAAYRDLRAVLGKRKVPELILGEGDSIRYRDSTFSFLAPNTDEARSKAVNDSSIVFMFENAGWRALFTGDIGAAVERRIAGDYALSAHLLKVSHHGSKFSSSDAFVREVSPDIAAIGVGKNSYGHPTPEALGRLARAGGVVLRTDRDGTLSVELKETMRVMRK